MLISFNSEFDSISLQSKAMFCSRSIIDLNEFDTYVKLHGFFRNPANYLAI